MAGISDIFVMSQVPACGVSEKIPPSRNTPESVCHGRPDHAHSPNKDTVLKKNTVRGTVPYA